MSEVIVVTKHDGFQFSRNKSIDKHGEDSKSDIEMDADKNASSIVTPGEMVTDDPIWMRGHGTYFLENKTYSAVVGTVSRVNRLLSVIPWKGRYSPETGDHIIGRIVEVGNKRWKVDIGGKQFAILMLGSVNLPGGVLRRKSESDELQMRSFLKEGDLLNAEVQSLFADGSASLHTRSLKYGKLRNGVFINVPSSLIVRSKNHTHNLPGNVTVILGVNGFIWLRKTSEMDSSSNSYGSVVTGKNAATISGIASSENTPGINSVSITRLEEESSWEIYSDKNDPISTNLKNTIAKYANVIKALAYCEIGITETRVIAAYEASTAYGNIGSLIESEIMQAIGEDVINAEKMRGNS
ncbi:exosome non-catalytic core subunit RRP4 Ecym_3224 [Eremothecium cymbalariae DBVPG|uniref:Uncharacterized protein n=1 Tax=Eremothecium cymbalariae (strain CBS 270.75 / DBVPG 7215 / KCTC 17166 / NRRL Y-17582) TaxID=931890 RepID=G8JRF2_ERECY|nr:Hypothetical protein Ecym_3224 [Eremothecium cymbalariae DBVPG\